MIDCFASFSIQEWKNTFKTLKSFNRIETSLIWNKERNFSLTKGANELSFSKNLVWLQFTVTLSFDPLLFTENTKESETILMHVCSMHLIDAITFRNSKRSVFFVFTGSVINNGLYIVHCTFDENESCV